MRFLREHDDAYWKSESPWTLENANMLLELLKPVYPEAQLRYLKHYITIAVDGNNHVWLWKRKANKSEIGFWFSEKPLQQAEQLLDKADISYVKKAGGGNGKMVATTSDSKALKNHAALMGELAQCLKASFED